MKRKIIYIFFDDIMNNQSSGVLNKINAKIESLNKLGIICKGVNFSSRVISKFEINEFVTILPIEKRAWKFFNSILQEKLLYKAVYYYLFENKNNFDYIIFRYPGGSSSLYKLTKFLKNQIVFEHNSKEIDELVLQSHLFRKSLAFSFKFGFFIYYFERGFFPTLFEKVYGKYILKNAKSGIAVTNEIAEYERSRYLSYNVKVISNGVDVQNCSLREKAVFTGVNLKLFMLTGSANNWHGIDRLVKSLENYDGKCRVTLDIIGSINEEDIKKIQNSTIKDKVNILDIMTQQELDVKLNSYHVGVGTLCAFRKGLSEASPLKTREYLARGFPVLIGYNDTDLMNNDLFSNYFYKVPADESIIDFDEVVRFLFKLEGINDFEFQIRNLSFKYLDTKVKMSQLIATLKD